MDERSNRARNSSYHNAAPFCQGGVLARESGAHHALRSMNARIRVFRRVTKILYRGGPPKRTVTSLEQVCVPASHTL